MQEEVKHMSYNEDFIKGREKGEVFRICMRSKLYQ